MSRLTAHKYEHDLFKDIYCKLQELEDLEEEIGIDLIEAAKLCKQVNRNKVVYIKKDRSIDTINLLDELDIELFNHRLYVNTRVMCVSLDLYNYGKTWALTKEELEENYKRRD